MACCTMPRVWYRQFSTSPKNGVASVLLDTPYARLFQQVRGQKFDIPLWKPISDDTWTTVGMLGVDAAEAAVIMRWPLMAGKWRIQIGRGLAALERVYGQYEVDTDVAAVGPWVETRCEISPQPNADEAERIVVRLTPGTRQKARC